MDRGQLTRYIDGQYGVAGENPWPRYPGHTVFRHPGNRKWFAVIMGVDRAKLGLPGPGELDIVNVKCPSPLIGSLQGEAGVFPAYHMSKSNWLSLALDGSAAEDLICTLVAMSYDATAPKITPKRTSRPPTA